MLRRAKNSKWFWNRHNPIAYAAILTALIFVGYLVIGMREVCYEHYCKPNIQIFWESDPNEIGDTLAGLFSVLAFVWIIATVLLQSRELAAQREQLELATHESERMATTLQAQTNLMQTQTEMILADSERRRAQDAGLVLDTMLQGLSNLLNLEAEYFASISNGEPPIFLPREAEEIDQYILRNRGFAENFFRSIESSGSVSTSRAVAPYIIVRRRVSEIAEVFNSLPEYQVARLRNMGLKAFERELDEVLNSSVWSERCSDPQNPLNFLGAA